MLSIMLLVLNVIYSYAISMLQSIILYSITQWYRNRSLLLAVCTGPQAAVTRPRAKTCEQAPQPNTSNIEEPIPRQPEPVPGRGGLYIVPPCRLSCVCPLTWQWEQPVNWLSITQISWWGHCVRHVLFQVCYRNKHTLSWQVLYRSRMDSVIPWNAIQAFSWVKRVFGFNALLPMLI